MGSLTFETVMARLEEIRKVADDDERAHGLEDDLYRDVLFAVAAHHPDSANLALAALRSIEINFSRWTA